MLRYGQTDLRFIDWNQIRHSLEWVYASTPPSIGASGHHEFAGLSAWLLLSGSVEMSAGGQTIKAQVGDWVFPPFREDQRKFSEDAEILSIRFRATWGGDNEYFQETIPRSCSSKQFPHLERTALRLLKAVGPQLSRQKNRMIVEHISADKHLKIYACFIQWLAEYFVTMRKIGAAPHQVMILDDRVQAAKLYLDTVSFQDPFKEHLVARHVGISVAQLNRLFIRDIGISPSAYYRDRKIDSAKRMLIDTSAPVKQIGYELGFNDPSNFTNWFRSKTHLSPKSYRASAMQSKPTA